MKHASSCSELVTLLLILHMVQGTFNQQKLQPENNLPSLCRHRLAKRGANLLLCMDLRKDYETAKMQCVKLFSSHPVVNLSKHFLRIMGSNSLAVCMQIFLHARSSVICKVLRLAILITVTFNHWEVDMTKMRSWSLHHCDDDICENAASTEGQGVHTLKERIKSIQKACIYMGGGSVWKVESAFPQQMVGG